MHVKDTIYKNNIQFKKQSSFLKKKLVNVIQKSDPLRDFPEHIWFMFYTTVSKCSSHRVAKKDRHTPGEILGRSHFPGVHISLKLMK